MNKQQELMEMIERLLAGQNDAESGAVSRTGGTTGAEDSSAGTASHDEELDRLLALAEEIGEGRPEPTKEFQEHLAKRMAELSTQSSVAGASSIDGSKNSGVTIDAGKIRWLPGWLTMPRIAAATAALVIALGLAGVTGALIRGGYQGKTTADTSAVSQSRAEGDNTQTPEQVIGGSAPQRTGEIAVDDAAEYAAPDSATSSGSTGAPAVAPLPSTQRIIQTADYRIEIVPGEFDEKNAQISAIALKYGGYVVSGDTRMGSDGLKTGSITIRIANANDNFTRAQTEVDGLGNVTSKKISGQDVTEEYVDLQSRLRNAEAQEAQYLSLMQRAQTIEEILTVQSRLAEVQSEIEQIKGRMKYMEGRTDFATISVELRETGEGGQPDDDGTNWGFVDSIRYAGWLAVQTLNFVIVSLGVIVPLLLIGGGSALLAYRIIQKRRARRDTGT
ncbi:MAG: DUF4349 domain-containing protein [Thermoleophilia bacterium]|nr:DUF4349 domain-containing protein [Thermoleophilia bacterium]